MYNDALLQFSDAQALTATAASTNGIDTAAGVWVQNGQINVGEPMAILIAPTVSADATTGDETYAVSVQTDDNSSFSSPTTLATFTITAANLAVGKLSWFGLPMGPYERYIRLNYTLGGTTPTVTLDAFMVPMDNVPKYTFYKSGFTIS